MCDVMYPDYQARWNAAVPQMRQYLSQQKILGFFACDECICHGAGDQLNIMIKTVRATFPRGTAIIYANECGSTFDCSDHASIDTAENTTEFGQAKAMKGSVPAELDWISIDRYRTNSDPGHMPGLRKHCYEDIIYPLMHDHQKVAIIPQVGHPKDDYKICDDECTAGVELQDAKDAVAWAQSDSRVALVAPYSWKRHDITQAETGLDEMGSNTDLKAFWISYGQGTKHL